MKASFGGLLILLASCLSLPASPPTSPEQVFQRIEASIQNAKTVRVKFKCQVSATAGGVPLIIGTAGLFLLKETNKVNISMKTQILLGSETQEVSVVSDGSNVQLRIAGNEREEPAPAALRDTQAKALSRAGPGPAAYLQAYAHLERPDEEVFQAVDFRFSEDDKEAKTLHYTLKLAGRDEEGAVKLWYDPATWKLLKRTVRFDVGLLGLSATLTETYTEFVLDGDLADDLFRVDKRCQAPPQEDRIRQLVAKLDDERVEVRDEAQRELVKIGDAALPHLRAAAAVSKDPEPRARAERAIREIELLGELREAYGDPTTVTIRAKDAALGQVLEEIGRQAGLTIDAAGVDKSSPVTIDAKDAPLLKVLDELCSGQAKRSYERGADGRIRFLAGPHPRTPAAYAGPFRIRLAKAEAVEGPGARPRSLYVEFEGDCDRYPKPVGKLAIQVESAADDLGTPLEIKYGYHTATEIRTRGSMTMIAGGATIVHPPPDPYEFTFVGIAPGASKVTLRGKATFAIPLRPRDVRFDQVEAGQRQESGGCTFILHQLSARHVCVRVHSASELPLFELAGRVDPESLVAVDEGGTTHRASSPFTGTGQWTVAPAGEGAYFGAQFPSLGVRAIREIRFRVGERAWVKTIPFELRGIPLP